jgi:four helix bundle protein
MYRETARWPRHELFGLTSQTRRAVVSVPANIAEGCGKNSDAELARHARNSLGSASELSYYLILAHDLEYMEPVMRDDLQGSLSEVRRMLASLERVLCHGRAACRTRHETAPQVVAAHGVVSDEQVS